ncbi:peroxidase family protein [Bradyrhizobium sp.]|uniref:peroxidase family protein n=1 Tax=Bradyrhizobium sp. TaxID=376 RepID=UPI0039E23D65
MRTPAIRPHGIGVRGSTLSRSSLLFEGPFGRIFRALPPADFGKDDNASIDALKKLGTAMISKVDPADPKDGEDDEESGIPAAYTYFGQFIDHDLTFDPASSLQKQNDPDALLDYRTPKFDLDNIYGRGPDDQPYLYEDNTPLFILGPKLTGAAANPRARDLQRSQPDKGPHRAIIGDPRNDENVIVSQLQGLLHRFHNKVAADMRAADPNVSFAAIQQEVRFHYQWIVLNDFLPTIVSDEALKEVLPKAAGSGLFKPNLQFYKPRNETFMPLEFSAAAYRFGHSMVRPGYRLSETIKPLSIFGKNENEDLRGFRKFPSNWAIDWNLFMDLEERDPSNTTRTQLAYKIDTSLVNPLGHLPRSIGFDPAILAQRNLLRGWRMRLPSGQAVAEAMGLEPLKDKEIRIGKFTGAKDDIVATIDEIDPAFKGNCPLWTYVLAETVEVKVPLKTTRGEKKIKTRKLGPVGGRIVAETIVGLLAHDSQSYVSQNPLWKPAKAIKGKFGLRELMLTALQG